MEQLNFADYTVLVIALACVGLGIFKGLRRCTLGFAVWVFAIVLAYIFGKSAGEFFTFIPNPGIKQAVGTVILLVVFGLLGILLRSLIFPAYKMPEVSKLDRFGGIFFGLFLASLLTILYLMSSGKSITEKDWYKKSTILSKLMPIAQSIHGMIPKSFKDRIDEQMSQFGSADRSTSSAAPLTPVVAPSSNPVMPIPTAPQDGSVVEP